MTQPSRVQEFRVQEARWEALWEEVVWGQGSTAGATRREGMAGPGDRLGVQGAGVSRVTGGSCGCEVEGREEVWPGPLVRP